MCGIAGIVQRPGVTADAAQVRAMTDAIRRRGPDAEGLFVRENVALGHRRLTIIDTSQAANQPMFNEDGSVVTVYNGEIYNFADLRAQLEARGHAFRTRSDTEVLVHGWEEWGALLVDRLRGMFALAIHDIDKRQLFLARDRLGKKPLYYAATPDRILFGSEIKAIRAAMPELGALDTVALAQYATYGNSIGERTAFTGVRKLPPAHRMLVDVADASLAFSVERYWDVTFEPDHGPTEAEWLERLDHALSESVRLRLISDVPLGAFLSGGIDSSLVAAYMTRHASRVETFTIGFREASHDESRYAGDVARVLGTDHHMDVVEPDALGVLPDLVDAYDEPFADSSAIPTYYLCRAARRSVTVALSGDGGDEIHAGYNRYTKGRLLQAAGRTATVVGRRLAERAADLVPAGLKGKLMLERLPLSPYGLYNSAMGCTDDHLALLRPEVRSSLPEAPDAELEAAFARATPGVTAMQYADVHAYLPDDILVKVDRASMWHSLEVRCPLLDHEFVELSARIPLELKLRGLRGKLLLRRLLERYVPRELIERPKMGFGVPVGRWFKRELTASLEEMLADTRSPMWQYFDRQVAERYVRHHGRRFHDLETSLWRLFYFHAWSRRHL